MKWDQQRDIFCIGVELVCCNRATMYSLGVKCLGQFLIGRRLETDKSAGKFCKGTDGEDGLGMGCGREL